MRPVVRFVDEWDVGVTRVLWQPDTGRADLALLVHGAHADRRWWTLADVLVLPSGPVAFDGLPGCLLIAVGPPECALFGRHGERTGVAGEIVEWAILGYLTVVSGGELASVSRESCSATRIRLGSSSCE